MVKRKAKAPAGAAMDGFVAWCHTHAELGAVEEAKAMDFLADLRAAPDPRGGPLGAVYRGFVRIATLLRAPRRERFPLDPARPAALLDSTLADEAARFDALSGHYAQRYRGAVVANYSLGVLAVLLAQLAATGDWAIPFKPWLAGGEVVALALIVWMFVRGRTPRSEPPAPQAGRRWFAQRWHDRWLDYRSLAERFRHADLLRTLRGLEGPQAAATAADPPPTAAWVDHYFAWRLHESLTAAPPAALLGAYLLGAMAEQRRYHQQNAVHCQTIAHRMHLYSKWLFAIPLLVALSHAVAGIPWLSHSLPHWFENAGWIMATGGLPALFAAMHGIAGTLELGKFSETSQHLSQALAGLESEVRAALDADPSNAAALLPFARQFWNMMTDDATGWRATLRDKNVPLP